MAEDKSAGVEFVATITGFDADGGPVNVSGSAANRVLAFGDDFVIAKDVSVNPNVTRASLRNGDVFIGNVKASTNNNVSIVSDTGVVCIRAGYDVADAVTKVELRADWTGFYGVTPIARQTVPTGSTVDQVITALQALGLFKQS